jgi:hypothetical protein
MPLVALVNPSSVIPSTESTTVPTYMNLEDS